VLAIESYTPSLKTTWDGFVETAKNSVFLFLRDYMDYHSDRFKDQSLLFRQEGKLIAVLPASYHEAEASLISHGGLTFGGLVTGSEMTAVLMLELFTALAAYLSERGVRRLVYKAVPHIYHEVPAEEDRYALFRAGAKLYRRDVTATIALDRRLPFQERRRRGVKKARAAGLMVRLCTDFASFWPILEHNLHQRHGVRPVHTLAEIQLLQTRFPDNIKLFGAYTGDKLLAGVVVYQHRRVVHAQYISASDEGRHHGALDLVFDYLISDYSKSHEYFDFGISTEDQGRLLNSGLSEQKEGFGARAIVHDFYEMELAAAA
jgi:hypothetical protein